MDKRGKFRNSGICKGSLCGYGVVCRLAGSLTVDNAQPSIARPTDKAQASLGGVVRWCGGAVVRWTGGA
jgi:hypothetical protein